MKAERYFQLCSLMPLVIPIIIGGPQYLTYAFLDRQYLFIGSFGMLANSLVASLYDTGLPYVVFAGIILLLLRGQSTALYVGAALLAPPAFVMLLVLIAFGFSVPSLLLGFMSPSDVFSGVIEIAALVAIFGLAMGYLYVSVSLAGFWLLRRLGRIDSNRVRGGAA